MAVGGGNGPNGLGNSVEDLNVEIYLNKPIQIGCVQLKLKFSRELLSNTTAPYELRLFRPKKSNEFSIVMPTTGASASKMSSSDFK